MALTSATYSATAGQTDFAITFPYIEKTHVYVKIDGEDTAAFTVNTGTGNVVLNTGATAGQTVRIYRKTPGRTEAESVRLVDFQDGSVLTESDLDKITLQLLYLSQEAQETGSDSLPIDFDGNYNAGGRRIKNMGTPALEADSVTKGYVDGLTLYGAGVAVPQSWSFEANDLSALTGTVTVVLDNPTPAGSNENLYVVSVDGYLQRPGSDFQIAESLGVYTLAIFLGATVLEGTERIGVQNFGIARSIVDPDGVRMPNADTPALTAIADPSPNVPVVVVEQNDGTDVLTIDNDGNVVAGGDITGGGDLSVPGAITANSITVTGVVNGSSSNIDYFSADPVVFNKSIEVKDNILLTDSSTSANSWRLNFLDDVNKPLRFVYGDYVYGLYDLLNEDNFPTGYEDGAAPIPNGSTVALTTVYPWSQIDVSAIAFPRTANERIILRWQATYLWDDINVGSSFAAYATLVGYDGSAIDEDGLPTLKRVNGLTNELKFFGVNSETRPNYGRFGNWYLDNNGNANTKDAYVTLNGFLVTTRDALTQWEYIGIGTYTVGGSNQSSLSYKHAYIHMQILG